MGIRCEIKMEECEEVYSSNNFDAYFAKDVVLRNQKNGSLK